MKVPIGYFRAKRGLKTLERYQDLVRHDWRWSVDINDAKPLEQLIPGLNPGLPRHEQSKRIDRELARLNPIVYQLLHNAGIPTMSESERFETDWNSPGLEKKMVPRQIDVVTNYENLERDSWGHDYNFLMGTLERGIGIYTEAQRRGFWDFFNPIAWTAWLIRLPLEILTRSGLKTAETKGKLAGVYINVVRTLILLALAFLAAKWGISAVDALKAFLASK